jgi:hypothetical protein
MSCVTENLADMINMSQDMVECHKFFWIPFQVPGSQKAVIKHNAYNAIPFPDKSYLFIA